MADSLASKSELQSQASCDSKHANQKPAVSKKIKTTRVLAIVTLVFSVITLVCFAFTTVVFGILAHIVFEDPSIMDGWDSSDMIALIGMLGLGQNVSAAQAFAWTYAIIAMFFGFCAILCLVTICASVALIRLPKRLEKSYTTYIFACIAAVVSIIALRPASCVIFAVCAWLIYKDHIERVGEENEFGNIKHMGAMRVIEFACLFTLVSDAFTLMFITHSSYYDAIYWVDFVQLLLMAVTLWLLWNRKAHSREIIIVAVFVFLVASAIAHFASGEFNVTTYTFNAILPVCLVIYLAVSKRAKAVLVQPWHKEGRAGECTGSDAQASVAAQSGAATGQASAATSTQPEKEQLWNPKSLLFWRDLLLFFCIFSVVGHWMEYWVCWLIRLGIVPGEYDPNSGIWHDMLNPFFVYGAAMFFIGLVLYPFKEWIYSKIGRVVPTIIVSFLANTLFCAVIELAMGFALNTPPDPVTGRLPLWDYSNMAFNFMGQICLLNTTFFGVMATIMTWLVYPNLERLFRRLPHDAMNILSVVVFVFFALVVCMYVVNVALPGNLNAILAASDIA